MRGRTKDPDAAAGVLNDRQYVHPGTGQRDGLDEVRGQQCLGLRAQELGPGGGGPIWGAIDPGRAQDFPDRLIWRLPPRESR